MATRTHVMFEFRLPADDVYRRSIELPGGVISLSTGFWINERLEYSKGPSEDRYFIMPHMVVGVWKVQ